MTIPSSSFLPLSSSPSSSCCCCYYYHNLPPPNSAMAASASTASFSTTSITSHLNSKPLSSDAAALLRIPCPRRYMPSLTLLMENLAMPLASHKKGFAKISAAVAQQEAMAEVGEEEAAAAAAATEDGGEEEDQDAAVAAQNTKLYFGNLPYNCDSAQLAGIIQEYASPEMVEVANYPHLPYQFT